MTNGKIKKKTKNKIAMNSISKSNVEELIFKKKNMN